jgi:ribonuclease T2
MSRATLLLAAVALAAFAACVHAYDYFVWAEGWPGSTCIINGPCDDPIKPAFGFLCHGLWPNNNDGSYPSFCDKSAHFDPNVLKPLMNDMNDYWPSLFENSKADGFWSHEWLKHGTCASNLFPTQLDYFTAVLQLRSKNNIFAALQNMGITGNEDETVSLSEVASAVKSMFGAAPVFECYTPHKGDLERVSKVEGVSQRQMERLNQMVASGQQMISELWMAVEQSADLKFMEFPGGTKSKCSGDSAVLPAWKW